MLHKALWTFLQLDLGKISWGIVGMSECFASFRSVRKAKDFYFTCLDFAMG